MFEPDQMLAGMLGAFGAEVTDVDRKRPLGLALSIPAGGEPRPTLVLPVLAPQEFQRSLQLAPRAGGAAHRGPLRGPDARPGLPGVLEQRDQGRLRAGHPQRAHRAVAVPRPDLPGSRAGPASRSAAGGRHGRQRRGGVRVGPGRGLLLHPVPRRRRHGPRPGWRPRSSCTWAWVSDPASSFARPLSENPVDLDHLLSFAGSSDDLVAVVGWDQPFLDDVVVPFFDRVGTLARSEDDERSLDQLQAALAFLPSLGDQVGVFGSPPRSAPPA